MLVKEIIDFIFKNYYKRIRFSKENSYYSMKHLKKNKKTKHKYLLLLANELVGKILDPHNAKEHYQASIRKKTQNK